MKITRREFLNFSGTSIIGASLPSWRKGFFPSREEATLFGRVTETQLNVRARPDLGSPVVGVLYEDQIVPWLREVIGYNPYRTNQRWVETPEGYIWSPLLQPVKNQSNTPVQDFPETSLGKGMWVEVTAPYVETYLDNPQPLGPRVQYLLANNIYPKLYYSQIVWADQIKVDEGGQVWYRLIEPHGSYGDRLWGHAEAFRPITAEEMSPISPEVENKRIDINIARQTMSCFENEREVHFSRISTGRLGEETPLGLYFQIFWKLVSVHMSAGSAGAGYDLTGVGWPTFFAAGGIAIHSTFWHNNYGEPTSAGCVNARPEDAKFVSRWTSPIVPYDPGVVDIGSMGIPSTIVRVFED